MPPSGEPWTTPKIVPVASLVHSPPYAAKPSSATPGILKCVVRVTPVSEVGLAPLDARQFLDEDFVYREYCCPGCGLLLQGDFTRSGDDDLWDIKLFPAGAAAAPGQEPAA